MRPLRVWITVGSLVVIVIVAWYSLYTSYRQIDDTLNDTIYPDLDGTAKEVYDSNKNWSWNIFKLAPVIFVLAFIYWGWASMQKRETVTGRYEERYG
jgi:type VI protein secretion system component VasF